QCRDASGWTLAGIPDQPLAGWLGPVGRRLVRAHRQARVRGPGRRPDGPAQSRLLPPVSADHADREPGRTGAPPGGNPDLEPRAAGRAAADPPDGARPLRRRGRLAVRPADERVPVLLLLQRRVLRESLPAARGRRAVSRRARTMGCRVGLRAPVRRDAGARAGARARARAPLPRAHPVRRPQAEAGRPLARAERAGALPLLRVLELRVRRPVARVQGDTGARLVAGGLRPPARRARDPRAALAGEPAHWP